MTQDPGTAADAGAVEVKTSLPPAGGLELLELAKSTDAELAGGAPGQPGAAAQPAAPPLTLERELAGMFAMMGAGAGHFLPSVAKVLDEQACGQLGDALAPVARKYGLDRYLVGFAWRVELQAVLVVVPIAIAVRQAAQHDIAAMAAAQAAAAGANPHPLGANVQPGAAVSPPVGMLQPIEATP